ncbi:MAG TPA: metallophosphoesterase [bacterium]|nr:metallophosphoesterase [bacterium]
MRKMCLAAAALALSLTCNSLVLRAQEQTAAGEAVFSEAVFEAEAGGVVAYDVADWKLMRMDTLSGGAAVATEKRGAAMEFDFTGEAVAGDFVIGKTGGRALASVDGRPAATIDLYKNIMTPSPERIVLVNGLKPGAHKLRLEILNESNPGSKGALVAVDALRAAAASYGAVSGTLECVHNEGLPVTRAKISATGDSVELRAITGVSGEFVFNALPPGEYVLRFEKPGFEPLEKTALKIESREEISLGRVMFEERIGARPLKDIRMPNRARPALARPGDEFVIEVIAPAEAGEWSAALENEFANYPLEIAEASFNPDNGRWTLKAIVPGGASSLLYGLRVKFSGGEDFQPRSVMVSPEFKNSIRVVHLTDVHVYKSESLFDVYKKLAEEINLVNPDLVVITGDLTDTTGYTSERWPESDQYPAMLDLWNSYNAPVFIVPGNHDLSPYKKEEDYLVWNRYFDTTDFSFDYGAYHFTAFDNSFVYRSGGSDEPHAEDLSPEQLEWLDADLAAASGALMRIIMFHVPLHNTDSKVKEIAAQRDVRLALYGHLHMDVVDKLPPVAYVQTGAAFEGSYRVLDLADGRVVEMNAKKDGFTAFKTGMVISATKRAEDGRAVAIKAKNSGTMALPNAAARVEMPTAKGYSCDGCSVVSSFDKDGKTLVTINFDIPAKGTASAVLTAE